MGVSAVDGGSRPRPVEPTKTETVQPAAKTTPTAAPEGPKPGPAPAKDAFKSVFDVAKSLASTASASTTKKQDPVSFSADANGVKVSGNLPGQNASAKGSVQVGPNGASATAGGSVTLPKGVKVGFESSVNISKTQKTESKDGFTTSTVEGNVSAKLSGNVQAGVVGAGASLEGGSKTSYQVRVPDAAFKDIQAGKAKTPDPYNPETLPVGGSVKLESKDFKNTHFEASYRQIKLDNDIKEEKGSSMLVEKTDPNTVRVTTGPSEAIENSFKVGVKFGPASASIGNTTKLDSSKLKTAEFDISTDAGKAAYSEFMATGKMPSQNGGGVANVATTEKLALSSTAELKASLGPIGFGISNSNKADKTVTTFPDGSKKVGTNIDYGSAVPVHIQQAFKPDGTEDISQQKFSLDLGKVDRGTAQYLTMAFTGDEKKAEAAFKDGQTAKLNLTPDQVKEVQKRTQDYIKSIPDWHPISVQDYSMQAFANAKDPMSAMVEIGRGWSGSGALGEQFLKVAMGFDRNSEFKTLPGDLTVS